MDNNNMTKIRFPRLGDGSAFLVGGNAHHCYKNMIELLGGIEKARIVVITHASEEEGVGRVIQAKLMRFGLPDDQVIWIDPGERLRIPPGFNGVFMSGGDQRRIMAYLSSADRQLLFDFLKGGGMVAGSSAGVPVFGSLMIAGGAPLVSDCNLEYGPGLGIIPGFFLDMHFTERLRSLRALTALGQLGHFLDKLLGFDEDTGLYIRNDIGTVYGVGGVHLYRIDREDFETDLAKLDEKALMEIDFAKLLGIASSGENSVKPNPHSTASICDRATFKSVIGLRYDCLGAGATIDFKTWKLKSKGSLAAD